MICKSCLITQNAIFIFLDFIITDEEGLIFARFIEIFEKLFNLCSVGILKEIMSSNYLEQIEKYRDDELGEIEASANASAADFADDVF